ncbi:MAG TPA: lipoprotein signal peptidase [Paludibacter sp.]|nr:lipoprotein signal peptidase [Paludibacter sp.]
MSIAKKSVLLIFLVLLIDQIVKIYVKLNFALAEHVDVFSWFKIYFIENNGMAFGMEFIGKLFLTLFRIVAVCGLAYYIRFLIKKQVKQGYILTISLVLAGAAGNIIDSLFYGILFSASDYMGPVATFLPEGGGYAPLFYGKVVDMLYFPLIKNSAGETIFFSPIFNIADAAISVAVGIILIFYRKELNESLESKKKQDVETSK